jgi:hypothetical protein
MLLMVFDVWSCFVKVHSYLAANTLRLLAAFMVASTVFLQPCMDW